VWISESPEQTTFIGREIGSILRAGCVLCLYGDLGAGKTTLIKGIAAAVTGTPLHEVTSPTFTYLNIYEGKCPLYHFDLYRLQGAEQFLAMGFGEFLDFGGICCIEWADRIQSILPKGTQTLCLLHRGEHKREIRYG
jgi:tRNA threonylcarbamoyladenosine biosynthesis protein TsaE